MAQFITYILVAKHLHPIFGYSPQYRHWEILSISNSGSRWSPSPTIVRKSPYYVLLYEDHEWCCLTGEWFSNFCFLAAAMATVWNVTRVTCASDHFVVLIAAAMADLIEVKTCHKVTFESYFDRRMPRRQRLNNFSFSKKPLEQQISSLKIYNHFLRINDKELLNVLSKININFARKLLFDKIEIRHTKW